MLVCLWSTIPVFPIYVCHVACDIYKHGDITSAHVDTVFSGISHVNVGLPVAVVI